MKNIKFLLSKDCLPCESLPCYGNKYWNTPNIDELAEKGTVFNRHYTAGGSTSMALSAMLSGHYPYEFKSRKRYTYVEPEEFPSIYANFQKKGYECHLIWDETWQDETWPLVREFGNEDEVIVHSIDIAQPAGFHKTDQARLERDDSLLTETYRLIYEAMDSIDLGKKQFVWMHLPHVLKGRRSYTDDIDVFDNIVGYARKLVGDDSLYITTDHGHMNLHKGMVGYGFHVYEPVIRIPLITPRISNLRQIDSITSNIDIPRILLENIIPEHKYVLTDTAYYAQPNRKLAITTQRFKYILNKEGYREELYDLEWDPEENYNILNKYYYDKDRLTDVIYDELYFYPYNEEAGEALHYLREVKDSIWREPEYWYGRYVWLRKELNGMKKKLKRCLHL